MERYKIFRTPPNIRESGFLIGGKPPECSPHPGPHGQGCACRADIFGSNDSEDSEDYYDNVSEESEDDK